jgi:HAD domain in Swiss Army Knife RNA repair proteins
MHVRELKKVDGLQEIERARPSPLLLLDIDGVISLFGFPTQHPPAGRFHAIEGLPHFISGAAAPLIGRLARAFDLAWASGWEDRANDHLPHLLGLPGPLPFLRFTRSNGAGSSMRAHWKLAAVDAYAGDRALAWVDDAFDESCEQWASDRAAPTLLVATEPAVGLTEAHVERLLAWAEGD